MFADDRVCNILPGRTGRSLSTIATIWSTTKAIESDSSSYSIGTTALAGRSNEGARKVTCAQKTRIRIVAQERTKKERSEILRNFPAGSPIFVYRTSCKSWEGPFKFTHTEGETVVVQLRSGFKLFRSSFAKPVTDTRDVYGVMQNELRYVVESICGDENDHNTNLETCTCTGC